MGRKLILHIGMPKTGTTAVQASLASAARKCELSNVTYPVYLHQDDINNIFISTH